MNVKNQGFSPGDDTEGPEVAVCKARYFVSRSSAAFKTKSRDGDYAVLECIQNIQVWLSENRLSRI